MNETDYPGINYSAGQPVNRNTATGIRYGVIPQNACNPDALEDIYSNGTDRDYEEWRNTIETELRSALKDYVSSRTLGRIVDSAMEDIGDDYESSGDFTRYEYAQDGYKLQTDSSGDIFVLESPYFTYAQFCSPCAPGACYLQSPLSKPSEANKCYCLAADWFENNVAPYPVYSVATGELIAVNS